MEATGLFNKVWKQPGCSTKCGNNRVVEQSVEATGLFNKVWKQPGCSTKCGNNRVVEQSVEAEIIVTVHEEDLGLVQAVTKGHSEVKQDGICNYFKTAYS